jgi:hypothetical protein
MFAQRRNRLTTRFSDRIPVVKPCISEASEMLRAVHVEDEVGRRPFTPLNTQMKLKRILCVRTAQ